MKLRAFFLSLLLSFTVLAQNSGSGQTLDFNGVNQYIDLNSSFGTINFPLTISLWFKPGTNQSGPIRFFSSHNMTGAYRGILLHYLNGDIDVLCGNGVTRGPGGRFGFKATYSLTPGRWHHIAFVLSSSSSAQCYVNGVAINTIITPSATGSPILSSDNSNGRIGANTAGSNITYLSGQMDEFTFWSKALNQSEIRAMMCRKLTGNEPNLMAYYRFDNGTGTTLSNIVSGGPDGTLVNGPSWVASSAPVGDWSSHNLYNNSNHAIGVSNSGDSIFIQPANTGQAGTHVYVVNSLPASTNGITVSPGINYYFGVFNVDYTKTYDVTVQTIGTTGFPNGTLKLAKRPDNASSTWTLTTATNTPDFSLPSQSPNQQFIITAGCPLIDLVPDDSTACDSIFVDIGNGYTNINWSNGHTSPTTAFFTSGLAWVTADDPVSGCTVSDTIDVTILNSGSLPNNSLDTLICGNGSYTHNISANGATGYAWYDGNTSSTRTFSKDGSYWYDVFYPGGCTTRDTLTIRFALLTTDPVEDSIFYICNEDTVEVSLRSNTYSKVLWSNGETAWKTNYFSDGNEWVTTQNADGCWQTDSFKIVERTNLEIQQIFKDTVVCAGTVLNLVAPDGLIATWPNGSHGSYPVSSSRDIRVEITDGCTESVEYFNVSQYSCACDVQWSNAFTPDGDGLNDFFGPATKCEFVEYEMQIFNRFGQQVFYSKNPDILFDGTWLGEKLPIGVYVFTFKYKTPYVKGTERGHITLIR